MQKIKRFWRVGAFIILLLFIALGALDFIWTNAANRPAHEWEVELPQNGQLTYRVYHLPRTIGPADSSQTLTWTKPDGSSHEYVISNSGSYYHDLELRFHDGHRAVWLIAGEPRRTVAILDLTTGLYNSVGGTVIFWGEGNSGSTPFPIPAWATLNNGKTNF